MKTRKIVALLLCAVLLVGASVMGTLAYLTDQTNDVTNTFKTVGKVSFDQDAALDEVKVDEYGNPLKQVKTENEDGDETTEWVPLTKEEIEAGVEAEKTENRVQENEYKLMPNHTYTKDPIVHIDEKSEECWVFVHVANGLAEKKTITVGEGNDAKDVEINGIEAATAGEYKNIEDQMKAMGWSVVDEKEGIWAYEKTVSKANDNLDVPVFEEIKVSEDADEAALEAYKDAKIVITAYAVQADGFDEAADAWADAMCECEEEEEENI